MTTRSARGCQKRGRDRNGACRLLRSASNLIADSARLAGSSFRWMAEYRSAVSVGPASWDDRPFGMPRGSGSGSGFQVAEDREDPPVVELRPW
jgi:hypothetical protein